VAVVAGGARQGSETDARESWRAAGRPTAHAAAYHYEKTVGWRKQLVGFRYLLDLDDNIYQFSLLVIYDYKIMQRLK
jgi:hypothetical protein